MNGRISKTGEVDRYKLAVSPGDHWNLELRARGLGTSRLDGVLSIYDNKGKKLASAGDKPPKEDVFSLLSAGRTSSDPWLDFTVPKDAREVTVTVEDLLQRGGPGYGYRLVARKAPADFTLTVANPYLNIPAKGTGGDKRIGESPRIHRTDRAEHPRHQRRIHRRRRPHSGRMERRCLLDFPQRHADDHRQTGRQAEEAVGVRDLGRRQDGGWRSGAAACAVSGHDHRGCRRDRHFRCRRAGESESVCGAMAGFRFAGGGDGRANR